MTGPVPTQTTGSGKDRTGFREVREEILRRIREKIWTPGAVMPNETDLAAELGCARATVNRAMRELAEEGVLERKRKAGTRVAAAPIRRAQLKIPLVRAEVEATGAAYRYRRLSSRIMAAPPRLKSFMTAGEVVRLTCLHLADDRPYQVEDRWISLVGVPSARSETFMDVSPNEWLVKEVPFTDVEVTFSAQTASDEVANLMEQPPGAPVFVTERATWAEGIFITFARLHHPQSYRMRARY